MLPDQIVGFDPSSLGSMWRTGAGEKGETGDPSRGCAPALSLSLGALGKVTQLPPRGRAGWRACVRARCRACVLCVRLSVSSSCNLQITKEGKKKRRKSSSSCSSRASLFFCYCTWIGGTRTKTRKKTTSMMLLFVLSLNWRLIESVQQLRLMFLLLLLFDWLIDW